MRTQCWTHYKNSDSNEAPIERLVRIDNVRLFPERKNYEPHSRAGVGSPKHFGDLI